MVPAHRWTFDVSVRRGAAGEVALGRWTFGPHRGVEEATGRAMQRLGHAGTYRYVPVGWPSLSYHAERCEVYRDIRETKEGIMDTEIAVGGGVRAGPEDAGGAMGG
jgi:hypothetical protein